MKKTFNFIRWVVSIPISIVLFVLVTLSLIIFPLVFKVTNPNSVKSWLNDSHTYERAPDLALDAILQKTKATAESAGQTGDIKSLTKNLISEEELRKSLNELFPPE